MIRAIILATVALTLAGCGSTRVRTVYVPVQIDAAFFDPALCSWPKKADHIVAGTDEEASSYDLAGYEAFRCERTARLGAGDRHREIVRDIERR
ncbi:hypothetical protein [Brevundimonas sp. TWP1-2-1b1]|uniref:hypothetical protein n=1 Tax=unclassified Brevundimonas TaxID=2622653 RepID=UPI003CF87C0B